LDHGGHSLALATGVGRQRAARPPDLPWSTLLNYLGQRATSRLDGIHLEQSPLPCVSLALGARIVYPAATVVVQCPPETSSSERSPCSPSSSPRSWPPTPRRPARLRKRIRRRSHA